MVAFEKHFDCWPGMDRMVDKDDQLRRVKKSKAFVSSMHSSEIEDVEEAKIAPIVVNAVMFKRSKWCWFWCEWVS